VRWIKVDIKGDCLAPKIYDRQTIDARVDFDFEEIETGDYITYMYGTEVNIKRVLVLEKGFFFLTNEKVIIKDEQIKINNKSFITLDGYNETVPDNCILVGSYLKPDPWVRIVHQDSIKYLTKQTDL
jgi:hypothetical protein